MSRRKDKLHNYEVYEEKKEEKEEVLTDNSERKHRVRFFHQRQKSFFVLEFSAYFAAARTKDIGSDVCSHNISFLYVPVILPLSSLATA